MELKELSEKTLSIFDVETISDLGDALFETVVNDDVDKMQTFVDLVSGDLSIDWLQKIYQYYMADRKDKKQDFTPISLAKLIGKLAKHKDIIDMCAGSGSLTIQTWNINKDCNFTLYELDDKVIPFLLFNLCIRNIEATVIQKDVITQEIYKTYRISKRDIFSAMEVIDDDNNI